MRIVQLIDSLETGGAERMAVNYANALADEIDFSGLVVTRKEGGLKQQIAPNVNYGFLHKKSKFDVKALLTLRGFIVKNKIQLIHAHSSSFFLAVLVKLTYPKIKIIWHDHFGNSEFLKHRSSLALKICSLLFQHVIVVNGKLLEWGKSNLFCKKITYLPNFFDIQRLNKNETVLKGISGKRIVCLANLREQKNHQLLLQIAELLKKTHPDWTFHLIGQDFGDNYSKEIHNYVSENLSDTVFIYGACNDVLNVLSQCEIGILTSKSEGLPVSLLEYGFSKLPVVVTAVGEIPNVIQNGSNGVLVSTNDSAAFYNALNRIIGDKNFKNKIADKLYQTVINNFSKEAVLGKYFEIVKK